VKKITVDKVAEKEYQEIVDLWEDAVRVTHSFLKEENIQYFKSLILEKYFYAVNLSCVRDANNRILAFMGTTDKKIEMLFISPDYMGQGIGKLLMNAFPEWLLVRLSDKKGIVVRMLQMSISPSLIINEGD
jgi:putative acetyltransferase